MNKIILLILVVFGTISFSQDNTNTTYNKIADQGWYIDSGLRLAWNFVGICARNRIYYRKALHRDKNHFIFDNSFLESGIEIGLAPFIATKAFVIWQPILPIRFNIRIGYYKDLLKEKIVDGPNGSYNHGYMAFTGLNPNNITSEKIDPNTFEIEFSPTFTLGGKIGSGALAFLYTPYMHFFFSSGVNNNQHRYFSRDSIVLKKQDIFWKHSFLFGYSFTDIGLTIGTSANIQHIQSISGIFRAGMFAAISYEKEYKRNINITPYARVQTGTWIKDRYLKNLFVIQAEVGVKYKFS